MSVLNAEDLEFFNENGYVIVRDAVPPENCQAVIDAIFWFLGMAPNDPNDWYREPHKPGAGMVQMHQHQALWDNRQYPKVHQAFADVWGREDLWVSMDRANFKPPPHPDYSEWEHKGFMHWDANTKNLPLKMGVQGVLYLTDTAANQGSFQCIPGAHKALLDEENPYVPELNPETFRQIPANAGDLLIWHVALPHGNGHNTSDKPRLAQYITMFPASENDEARRKRVSVWENREPSPGFPGDPRKLEETGGTTAQLTPLGRKLLGLDTWN